MSSDDDSDDDSDGGLDDDSETQEQLPELPREEIEHDWENDYVRITSHLHAYLKLLLDTTIDPYLNEVAVYPIPNLTLHARDESS